jgi:hypothetical protein
MKLAGRKKEHVALNDEAGWPRDTTLCGIPCFAANRTYSKRTATLSGRECRGCLARLTPKKRSTPKGWIPSHGPDKRIHWLAEDQRIAACGQEYSTWETGWIEMVTCERCLAIAEKAGVQKRQEST